MSLQIKVDIPLEKAALIRSTPSLCAALDSLAKQSDHGSAIADTVRLLINAVNDLPFDFVRKNEHYATSDLYGRPRSPVYSDYAGRSIHADSLADEELEEIVDEEDEHEGDTQINVVVKDSMRRLEEFEMWDCDTFDDLADAYSNRTDTPTDRFYFKHEGQVYGPAGMAMRSMYGVLKKCDVTDGSVIKVYAVDDSVVLPARTSSPAVTSRPSTPPSCSVVPLPEFTHVDEKIKITVRNLMNQVEHFTISHDTSLYKFAKSYRDRTGLDIDSMRFKFPSQDVFNTNDQGGITLRELGLLNRDTVVAMPEDVYY